MAWAIKDAIRREQRRNIKAFNIGRKLALEPRTLPPRPEPITWEQLVTNKSRILRKTHLRGSALASRYEQLANWAVKQLRGLSEPAKYDLVLRLYDLMQYQNYALARRYLELVRGIYRRDATEHDFAATGAVIWNLAKVLLIKDEPYVAYLLTRYEKKQRDIAKYGLDVSNGDSIIYRHHTSPEFHIGRLRIRLRITTRDWHLRLVRSMKWLRRLPGWHKRETEFRDWYISLLDRVSLCGSAAYEQALAALKSPEPVTGYREVRYPKQDQARLAVEAELGRTLAEPNDPSAGVVNSSVIDSLRQPEHI
jgi:hypothetical protein